MRGLKNWFVKSIAIILSAILIFAGVSFATSVQTLAATQITNPSQITAGEYYLGSSSTAPANPNYELVSYGGGYVFKNRSNGQYLYAYGYNSYTIGNTNNIGQATVWSFSSANGGRLYITGNVSGTTIYLMNNMYSATTSAYNPQAEDRYKLYVFSFAPAGHTVTFNMGGHGTAPPSQTVDDGSYATRPATDPTDNNYRFVDWYTDSSFTNVFDFDNTPITADTTIYAKWEPKITINFNSMGGTGNMPQQIGYGTIQLNPNQFTRTDNTFMGWGTTGGGVDYLDEATITVTQPTTMTLYAIWQANPIVIFNMNGHGGANIQVRPPVGSTVSPPSPDPTASGWTFQGWYADSQLRNLFDFTTPITQNTNIYAKWAQNLTVTFNMNGHGTQVPAQTVPSNSTATEPSPAPTDNGYTFMGWFSNSQLTQPFDFSTPITANRTLYAKWEKNPTITFDLNGHGTTPAPSPQTVPYDTSATRPTPAPTDPNYVFGGWYENSACTGSPFDFSTQLTADKILYAKWTPKVYTITLDKQGAESAGTASYYEKYGDGNYSDSACTSEINTITPPTKAGYTFAGYYTGANGSGTQYIDANGNISSTPTTFSSDTTLYAYWTQSDKTLTVSKTVAGEMGEVTKNFAFTISNLTPNASYSFTDATGATTTITADASGEYGFNLKHGERVSFTLPVGTTVTVTEDDYSAEGYTTSVDQSAGRTKNITLNSDTTVAFTNTLKAVSPTGFHSERKTYVWILSLGALALIACVLVLRKGKNKENR